MDENIKKLADFIAAWLADGGVDVDTDELIDTIGEGLLTNHLVIKSER